MRSTLAGLPKNERRVLSAARGGLGRSPPVGMTLYVIKGIARDVPIGTIFRGAVPFLAMEIILVALIIAFPVIVTFLPSISAG